MQSSDFISGITLLIDEKNSITTGNISTYGLDWNALKETDWYKNITEAQGKSVWVGSHPEINSTTSATNYIFSSARVYKSISTGRDLGILIIDVNLKSIEEVLKGVQLGDTGELHLITPDGKDISFSGENGTSNLETRRYLEK